MIATAKLTGAEFDALPYEEGRQWELLEGDLIDVPSPTARHQLLMGDLFISLRLYLRSRQTGTVLPDVEFAIGPNIRLRPDVAVLLEVRWRSLDLDVSPVPGSPDIAIEIISPSERAGESARKVKTYLKHGVQEVWQLFPLTSDILVHRADSTITVLRETDILSTPLLPDWQMTVAEILPLQ